MIIYPEAPGESPPHRPGLSLRLWPSLVLAPHRRLCLRTQKLPAYTTSQVTPLSGLGLTAALPQQSDVAFLRLHFKVHLLRNNNTRF